MNSDKFILSSSAIYDTESNDRINASYFDVAASIFICLYNLHGGRQRRNSSGPMQVLLGIGTGTLRLVWLLLAACPSLSALWSDLTYVPLGWLPGSIFVNTTDTFTMFCTVYTCMLPVRFAHLLTDLKNMLSICPYTGVQYPTYCQRFFAYS